MSELPAILGGEPLSKQKIHFALPTLPPFSELGAEIENVIKSGMLTKGKYLAEFEKEVAEHLGTEHSIGVSSCTSGLMLVYQALELAGSEVIVPSFTFMATVSALIWVGAKPVFVDVDAGTTNIDVSEIEKAITPKTKAIVAVHNFGNPADIEELEKLAAKYKLRLIFDSAHGFGSLYQGKPVGGQGDAHIFSMSPTKLLVAGEGGVVTTNNSDLAEKVRLGREYGNNGNYDSAFPGINARLPELNALLAIRGLSMLESNASARSRLADLYKQHLGAIPGIEFQEIREGNCSSYKDFSIFVNKEKFGLSRDELAAALDADGIDTRKYYDPPVHLQTAYKHLCPDGNKLPNTIALAQNSLSLPMWSHMPAETVEIVSNSVEKAHQYAWQIKQGLLN